MPTLTRSNDVFVLHLRDNENRFHPNWLAEVSDHLDAVTAAPAPAALVTIAEGKIWSNGLDLEWLGAHRDEMIPYIASAQALFAKMLVLPVPTVAAVTGHAFGGGAMLALAHDFRVMRADRGFFCLPEVHIGMPFTDGMAALVQGRLSKQTAHEAMTTGGRYGGEDAIQTGIVEAIGRQDEVIPASMAQAASLADNASSNLGEIKSRMYREVIKALLVEP